MFRERKVKKTYWSVVVGTPKYDQGTICIPLREAIVNGRHMTVLGTTHHSGPNEDCVSIYLPSVNWLFSGSQITNIMHH